jgi:hypothetical protein
MRGDDRAAVIERAGEPARIGTFLRANAARMLVAGMEHQHDAQLPGKPVERVESRPRRIDALDGRVDLDQPAA